jgi:hypothetical protein
MSSPDQPDGSGPGPGVATRDENEGQSAELSSRGRVVIRSSSRPPRSTLPELDAREVSGARSLPAAPVERQAELREIDEARAKKSTPAERPRKRRQVQAAQAMARARRDTKPARPASLRRPRQGDEGVGEPQRASVVADPSPPGASAARSVDPRDPLAAPAVSAVPSPSLGRSLMPAEGHVVRVARKRRSIVTALWVAAILLAAVLLWALLRG